MNIYLVSQDQNTDYDTYDSFVVIAPDEETARYMNPLTGKRMTEEDWNDRYSSWCKSPANVKVKHIGIALESIPPGIICASFNAG